jgi:hypothetical protein
VGAFAFVDLEAFVRCVRQVLDCGDPALLIEPATLQSDCSWLVNTPESGTAMPQSRRFAESGSFV